MTDLLQKFSEVHGPPEAKPEVFDAIFEKAITALAKKYIPGTYEYVYTYYSVLYRQLVGFENDLNRLWCTDINAFREVLSSYYRITLDCIQIYKNSLDFHEDVSCQPAQKTFVVDNIKTAVAATAASK